MSHSPLLLSVPARLRPLLAVATLLGLPLFASGAMAGPRDLGYQYLAPAPGARLVSPWNNVVIRQGATLDAATVTSAAVTVSGTRSGVHAGRLVLSDDGRTLVFRPDRPFAEGESVGVSVGGGVRTRDGAPLPALAFGFTITTSDPRKRVPVLPEEVTGGLPFA